MKKPFVSILILGLIALSYMAISAYFARQAIEAELAKAHRIASEIKTIKINADADTEIEPPENLEQQIKDLESANRERHRLRNEVRQLREQTKSIDQLREQNLQLRESLSQSRAGGTLDLKTLNFVSSSEWRDVGMNSPENAVTSFFHYLSQGNIDALLARCFFGDGPNPIESLTEETREQASESLKEFSAQVPAFRISKLEHQSESDVSVQIQTALEGEALPFKLRKVGSEWKLNAEGEQFF